jgi:hypothetical protein
VLAARLQPCKARQQGITHSFYPFNRNNPPGVGGACAGLEQASNKKYFSSPSSTYLTLRLKFPQKHGRLNMKINADALPIPCFRFFSYT